MKKEVLRLTKGTIPPISKDLLAQQDRVIEEMESTLRCAGAQHWQLFHPLKNPDSKHYQMVDGVEAIERLEQMYSKEELMIWAKISAMKYRLRIANKDAVEKEAVKIKGFEAYYTYLKESIDAQTPPNSSL